MSVQMDKNEKEGIIKL